MPNNSRWKTRKIVGIALDGRFRSIQSVGHDLSVEKRLRVKGNAKYHRVEMVTNRTDLSAPAGFGVLSNCSVID
jgi:hypothetical protein